MELQELHKLLEWLVSLPRETELVEFKANFHSKEEIGERISALSNTACLLKKPFAYMVFGIDDATHSIDGTDFNCKSHMVGNEDLESWLINRLNPRIDYRCYNFLYEGKNVSLYKIPATDSTPVKFLNVDYIRVNSITRKLLDFPEKEKQIWKNEDKNSILTQVVKSNLGLSDIVKYLSTETYFDLMNIPYPTTTENVVARFVEEKLVEQNEGSYSITGLGALLFAKNLKDFDLLSRKAVRVIKYKGKNKIETERDMIDNKGYAVGFTNLLEWINGQLPANEIIGKALRKDYRMYPELAIRELVANSIIHQDFGVGGFPTIEIYSDRIEISNPGNPIIKSERFIDEYGSRNDKLADIMRRMGFCEEKGSGLDKVIFQNELFQLPAIDVRVQENRTTVVMFCYQPLQDMGKDDRIRACYQHACLRYVSNEKMTNQSIRERFGIEEQNAATASRIIKETLDAHKIKEDDPENKSRKYKKYVPWWA